MNIYETKYLLRPQYSSKILARLKHNKITPIKFANAHLKTIYFDCNKLSSFNQSANGELKKIKFRFREYINPDSNGANYSLEVKIRNGIGTDKIKYLLDRAYLFQEFCLYLIFEPSSSLILGYKLSLKTESM